MTATDGIDRRTASAPSPPSYSPRTGNASAGTADSSHALKAVSNTLALWNPGSNDMTSARKSSGKTVKVDPRRNRPRNARESVPEALVPDVIHTHLHRDEGPEGAASDRLERIARRAYELAQQRGFTPGAELDDWLQAEREIDASTQQAPPEDQFTG